MQAASKLFGGVQVVSQVRGNQLIRSRGKWIALESYFKRTGGVTQKIRIRGEQHPTLVTVSAARLVLKAHGSKCFLIALKYEGETEYRSDKSKGVFRRYDRSQYPEVALTHFSLLSLLFRYEIIS